MSEIVEGVSAPTDKTAEELAGLKNISMVVYALQALSFLWGVTAIVGFQRRRSSSTSGVAAAALCRCAGPLAANTPSAAPCSGSTSASSHITSRRVVCCWRRVKRGDDTLVASCRRAYAARPAVDSKGRLNHNRPE